MVSNARGHMTRMAAAVVTLLVLDVAENKRFTNKLTGVSRSGGQNLSAKSGIYFFKVSSKSKLERIV
jgi:hypothetical protein